MTCGAFTSTPSAITCRKVRLSCLAPTLPPWFLSKYTVRLVNFCIVARLYIAQLHDGRRFAMPPAAPAPAPQNSGLSDQVKAFVIAFPGEHSQGATSHTLASRTPLMNALYLPLACLCFRSTCLLLPACLPSMAVLGVRALKTQATAQAARACSYNLYRASQPPSGGRIQHATVSRRRRRCTAQGRGCSGKRGRQDGCRRRGTCTASSCVAVRSWQPPLQHVPSGTA